MRMSARILGSAFGLTGQEMNVLLKQAGYLDGEPGAYSVTAKGEKYAEEKDEHRGPGGYGWYNRDWTTRTWDESIANELDVTDEKKQQIREQVAEARRAARAPAPVVEEQLESQAQDGTEGRGLDARYVLAGGGLLLAGFGIYKAAPHIKRFVNEKVIPRFKKTEPVAAEMDQLIDQPEDTTAGLEATQRQDD